MDDGNYKDDGGGWDAFHQLKEKYTALEEKQRQEQTFLLDSDAVNEFIRYQAAQIRRLNSRIGRVHNGNAYKNKYEKSQRELDLMTLKHRSALGEIAQLQKQLQHARGGPGVAPLMPVSRTPRFEWAPGQQLYHLQAPPEAQHWAGLSDSAKEHWAKAEADQDSATKRQ